MGFVGGHRKRVVAKVTFLRKVSSSDKAGGGTTFNTCLHENKQGGMKCYIYVSQMIFTQEAHEPTRFPISYLCSAQRADKIRQSLCILFLVISGNFGLMPMYMPYKSRGGVPESDLDVALGCPNAKVSCPRRR